MTQSNILLVKAKNHNHVKKPYFSVQKCAGVEWKKEKWCVSYSTVRESCLTKKRVRNPSRCLRSHATNNHAKVNNQHTLRSFGILASGQRYKTVIYIKLSNYLNNLQNSPRTFADFHFYTFVLFQTHLLQLY